MQSIINQNEAKALINDLESINLKENGAEAKIHKILYSRPVIGFGIMVEINPHPELFYVRARLLDSIDDYLKTIDDHSYNKKIEFVKRGRANFYKQSIFYAGRTRVTSLAELNVIENKKDVEKVAYGISRWVIKKPTRFVAILNPDTVSQMRAGIEDQNLIGEIDNVIDGFQSFCSQIKGTKNEGILTLYRYISDKFTEKIVIGEEYKYILTSILANQIFKATPKAAGILYQSVKWPQTYNIALKPQFIDNGYIEPSHFFKEVLLRENVTELKEISLQHAKSFDIGQNIVEW